MNWARIQGCQSQYFIASLCTDTAQQVYECITYSHSPKSMEVISVYIQILFVQISGLRVQSVAADLETHVPCGEASVGSCNPEVS